LQSESVKIKKRNKIGVNDDFGVKMPEADIKNKYDDGISEGEEEIGDEIQHEELKL